MSVSLVSLVSAANHFHTHDKEVKVWACLKVSLAHVFKVRRWPSVSIFSILVLIISSVLSELVPVSRPISGDDRKSGRTLSFSPADPARRTPAFPIVPTDREPGKGLSFSTILGFLQFKGESNAKYHCLLTSKSLLTRALRRLVLPHSLSPTTDNLYRSVAWPVSSKLPSPFELTTNLLPPCSLCLIHKYFHISV